jgi:hydroxymethylglutaryl-CoA lyase
MEKLVAAYEAGARRFDSAIGGLGGCPLAQDTLVGNVATERLLEALSRLGIESPLAKPIDGVILMSADIAARYESTQG